MTKNNRYERRPDGNVVDNKTGEAATGVPITEDTPAGAPQFTAYEAEVERQREQELNKDDGTPIEDRDQRGSDVEGGKHTNRLSMAEIEEMAGGVATKTVKGEHRVATKAEGDKLTVTVTTVHGTASGSADVDSWTAAGVKKALGEIEDKLSGKSADAPDDSADTRLANAVRDAVKG